jgi:NitT/TauT family transport system substrate-binding protein
MHVVRAFAHSARRFAVAGLGAAFILSLAPAAHATDALALVRVATIPIDAGSEVYYADKLGFFAKNGIQVEITALNSGSAVTAGVVGGAADVGQSNAVPLSQAHERGIPLVIVAAANHYSGKAQQAGLIVDKDSPIKTAKDFNGKTIGIAGIRGIMEVGIRAWLDKNGADANSVKLLDMPFPEMAAAVSAHRIDGAVLTEPVFSANVKTGKYRVIADPYTAIAPEFLMGAWFSTSAWAQANPKLVTAYSKSILEAAKWANTHQKQSAQILEDATKVPMGESVHRVPFAERLDAADLQPLIDACAKYGLLKTAFPAQQLLAQQ